MQSQVYFCHSCLSKLFSFPRTAESGVVLVVRYRTIDNNPDCEGVSGCPGCDYVDDCVSCGFDTQAHGEHGKEYCTGCGKSPKGCAKSNCTPAEGWKVPSEVAK